VGKRPGVAVVRHVGIHLARAGVPARGIGVRINGPRNLASELRCDGLFLAGDRYILGDKAGLYDLLTVRGTKSGRGQKLFSPGNNALSRNYH
jgi:hypothetical protein